MSEATDNLANAAANTINTATDGAASAASAVANSQTLQTLDSALAQMITESVKATGDALAWAKGQIPDLINQLLVWHFVSSLLIQMICVAYFVAYGAGIYQICKPGTAMRKSWDDVGAAFGFVLFGFIAFVLVGIVFATSFDWLKIWIAPKLYLVEYAAGLVK